MDGAATPDDRPTLDGQGEPTTAATRVACEPRQVARRVDMPALWRLVSDPAPEVRRIAAERLPAPLLDALIADPDWTVRWEAAGRALGAALHRLLADAEPEVRKRAAQRRDELEFAHG